MRCNASCEQPAIVRSMTRLARSWTGGQVGRLYQCISMASHCSSNVSLSHSLLAALDAATASNILNSPLALFAQPLLKIKMEFFCTIYIEREREREEREREARCPAFLLESLRLQTRPDAHVLLPNALTSLAHLRSQVYFATILRPRSAKKQAYKLRAKNNIRKLANS